MSTISSEWLLQAHLNGDFQNINSGLVKELFKKYKGKIDKDNTDFIFDLNNSTVIFAKLDEEYINSIMISRPCIHEDLGKLLFEIMKLGNFILYAPDGNYPIILNKNVIDELPEGMIDVLGNAEIAEGLEDFLRLLDNIYK